MSKNKNKTMNVILIAVAAVVVLLLVEAAIIFWPWLTCGKGYTDAEQRALTIVAHRGGASIGPENTLENIERGIQAGADMIEIDVHLTADGHVVVCHDQTVDRTTNGSGRIRNMTLDSIRQYNIVYRGETTELKIPTFSEVLQLVDHRCRLLVEIKRTNNIYQGIEQKVAELIREYGARDEVVVQSFNNSVLENMHACAPELRLEKLVICKVPGLPLIFDGTFSSSDIFDCPYIESFNFFHGSVTEAEIRAMERNGKEVKIWTLEGPESAIHLPVTGIITNRPDLWK